MARNRLMEDVVANPARFYRMPVGILRERRFDDGERARILEAWAYGVDNSDPALRKKIEESRQEIARKSAPPLHSN
jgi:hypothetical protein